MPWDYLLMDVFAEAPFGGNALAVFPDARGISPAAMQPIARELNLSETVFAEAVPGDPHAWRARIFTPAAELPFAGHPTVGTAAALVHAGLVPVSGDTVRVVLHEGVGPVPVDVALTAGRVTGATFAVPRPPEIREAEITRDAAAEMLGLEASEVLDGDWRPRAVGWTTAFHFVAVKGLAAVRRTRLRRDVWERALGAAWAKEVYVFCAEAEQPAASVHARMFAPALGIEEDPATGSAAAALAGFLAAAEAGGDGRRHWTVEQGFEMGRPSLIEVEADIASRLAIAIRVGGRVVMMGSGRMELGSAA